MDRESARGSAYAYNAVAMDHGWDAYCDHTLDFQWPAFKILHEIWNKARGNDALPRRSALTARLLKDYLRSLTIYERYFDDDGVRHYRVRLMGTAFATVYGDQTGKVIDRMFVGEKLIRYNLALDRTLSSPTPLRIIAAADIPDKSFLSAEYFMGPMADAQGQPAMVLTCAHFEGDKPWSELFSIAKSRIAARELA